MKIIGKVFERWFPTKAPEFYTFTRESQSGDTAKDSRGVTRLIEHIPMVEEEYKKMGFADVMGATPIPDVKTQGLPVPTRNTQNHMVLVALADGVELTADDVGKLCRSGTPNARISDVRKFLKSHGIYLEPIDVECGKKAHRLSVWDREQLKGLLE